MISNFKLYVKWCICIVKYFLAMPIALIFRKLSKYKNIWLIAERGTDARDNGYHFFKYIREKKPEINAYYLITKKSPDREKVTKIGNLINTRSFKHYLYFILSDKKISTHIMGYAPDTYLFMKLDNKFGLVKGKKVFLQHGITKDYIAGLCYPNIKVDLFICGAKPEFDFVNSKFNFNNNIVKYLGFCRFDNLFDKKIKKQILIMPTWRTWLNNCKDIEAFKQSDYYKRYNSLISNESIVSILEKYDYEILFYPHYEVQKYIEAFHSSNIRLKIANFKNYDIQVLLKESAVLITDYSSTFFDFAYMKKSVIHYQFDYEEYREAQYSEGYFSYSHHGFGPIFQDESNLVNHLITSIKSDFKIDENYLKRIDGFFPLQDRYNCKRNLEAILELDKE